MVVTVMIYSPVISGLKCEGEGESYDKGILDPYVGPYISEHSKPTSYIESISSNICKYSFYITQIN